MRWGFAAAAGRWTQPTPLVYQLWQVQCAAVEWPARWSLMEGLGRLILIGGPLPLRPEGTLCMLDF